MKSIREWLSENNMDVAMRNVMGGTMAQVDPNLKTALRSKLEMIMKDHENEDPISLFRGIVAATLAILFDIKGTRISVSQVSDLMQKEEGEEKANV